MWFFFVVFSSSISFSSSSEWVSENNQTRWKSCHSIFSTSKHASLPSKMSALSLYSLIPSLQSDKSLNSTKHKAMDRIESEGWEYKWRQMTSSAFVLSCTHSQSLRHFWSWKSSFWRPKFKKYFWEHIFKIQNC